MGATMRWISLAAAALAASAALSGCLPCNVPATSRGAWSFEGCASARCGFQVERGEARVVPLFHPGEHGLDLDARTTVRVDLTDLDARTPSTVDLSLLARCEPGVTLTATVDAMARPAGAAPGDGGVAQPTTLERQLDVTTQWQQVRVMLGTLEGVTEVRALRLSTTGASRCQVDDVTISRVAFQAFCD